jgi:hypothetical protein
MPRPDLADHLVFSSESESHRVEVRASDLPLPQLVHYFLVDVLGFTAFGPFEKTAWLIPFSYQRATSCTLAYEKFGVRLYLARAGSNPAALAQLAPQIVGKLARCLRKCELRALAPLARAQLVRGNVTLRNQFFRLDDMYRFFRREAAHYFQQVKQPSDSGGIAACLNAALSNKRHGFYLTIAMLDAYYSRLEHFVILALAFSDYSPIRDDLSALIGASWQEKFRRAFPPEPQADRFLERLRDLKERYRNTFLHGGFDKEGAALGFHLPGAGAIPALMSAVRGSPHFRFIPVQEPDYNLACGLFDEFDAWVEKGPHRFALRYARSGLDVPFDTQSLRARREAMVSDAKFDGLIEGRGRLWELDANMDY